MLKSREKNPPPRPQRQQNEMKTIKSFYLCAHTIHHMGENIAIMFVPWVKVNWIQRIYDLICIVQCAVNECVRARPDMNKYPYITYNTYTTYTYLMECRKEKCKMGIHFVCIACHLHRRGPPNPNVLLFVFAAIFKCYAMMAIWLVGFIFPK